MPIKDDTEHMPIEDDLDDMFHRTTAFFSILGKGPFSREVAGEIPVLSINQMLKCRARGDYDTMNRILDWQGRYVAECLQGLADIGIRGDLSS